MNHRINSSLIAAVLLLSPVTATAAESGVGGRGYSDDSDGASAGHLRKKLPLQLQQFEQQQQQQQPSSQSNATPRLHQDDTPQQTRVLKPKIAKRAKKKKGKKSKKAKKNKNKGGGGNNKAKNKGSGGGGGGCTPQEQNTCCSKYKKPDFNMVCKKLGCKTNKCKRFNSAALFPSPFNENGDGSLAKEYFDHHDWSTQEGGDGGSSLAQQYLNSLRTPRTSLGVIDEDDYVYDDDDDQPSSSTCGGGCDDTPSYTILNSSGYQEGDTVENDCVMYRCREYPFSLWCTNEVYIPGTEKGETAWEMVGPC